MLQIRNITRTILASMLAVMVAVSFYPATAFADTDYEAAYNQAKANTQAAYTEWQTALANVDTTYSAWQTAKANYETAKATVTEKKNDMDKKHRILDYATRNAIDYYAEQAWKTDYGTSITNSNWYYDTESRMQAILYNAYGNVSWHSGATTQINRFKTGSASDHNRANNWLTYGVTTSASGEDNTSSLDLYSKYVYFNESYDMLMLSLDYFNEHNYIRNNNQNNPNFAGTVNTLVSPYLMMQAMVNAPINNNSHSIRATSGANDCSQNIASRWGEVNTSSTNLKTNDPFTGLFYGEMNATDQGHFLNILKIQTHAGMACSWNTTGKTFEQDIINSPGKTGYAVETYRGMINSRVSSELSAYNNAVNAYENAVDTAEDYADIRDDALDDYTDAQALASQKEIAYNNALTAENEAYQTWQNWLANQNQGGNTDPGTNPGTEPGTGSGDSPDPGTTPDPPVEPPTNTSQVTGITATATSATSFKVVWNAVSGVDSYNVYVDNGDETKKYSASSNSRAIPNCVTNETYLIQVSTIVDGEEGPKSNIYTFTLTYNTGGNTGGDDSGGGVNDDPSLHGMQLDSDDQTVGQVTGVTLTETPNNGSPIITVKWNAATNASKYYVYVTSNGNTQKLTATASGYQVKNCKPSTAYNVKVSGVSSNGTEGQVSLGKNITTSAYTPPAPPKPTVGTPSITKTKVTAKSKKVDIWFSAAKNAKSYKVEIRRIYKLKGKKKIAVSSGWKAYNVTSPTKTAWVYKKKVTAKQAKQYKGNANYKLTKSGKKYKLYHKEHVAPVTATKLTRKSIYQVRVTAYNGSAHQTSVVKTFTIK